jgi:hypothetical protein
MSDIRGPIRNLLRHRSGLNTVTAMTAVTSLALGGLALLPGWPNSTTSDPSIPQSADANGPTFATGTLKSVTGTPAAAGTNVVLWAWPATDSLETLKLGDTVPLVPVTEAQTDAAGNFALVKSAATDLSRFRDRTGHINFEIRATAPNHSGGTNDWDYSFVAADADSATQAIATPAPSFALKPIDAEPSASRIVPDQGGVGCGPTTLYKKLGEHWVALGGIYLDTTGVSGQLKYSTGSSTAVGVGISASGADGSFSADGTASSSSDDVSLYPTHAKVSKTIDWTHFDFNEYRTICNGGAGTRYEVRVGQYDGGAAETVAPSFPAASHCERYPAGQIETINHSSAVTWSAGASLGAPIGFTATAQSGYNAQTSLIFHFSTSQQLCGTKGKPSASPSRLVAK